MSERQVDYRAIWALMVGVLLVAFWLRVGNLAQYPAGLSRDEAINVIDALHAQRSGGIPFYQDPDRSEPLYRVLQAFGGAVYGHHVFLYRLTSVFVGMVSVAAAYWATTQLFADQKRLWAFIAGLLAAITLTILMGHVTLSRSLYRGMIQILCLLFLLGFLARALRHQSWRDYAWAGVWLGLLPYTYTSSFVIPAAFAPFGLSLLLWRWRTWRVWLPRLVLMGAITGLIVLPLLLTLLATPEAVINRAGDLSAERLPLSDAISRLLAAFFTQGDVNPQYNSARQPLLHPLIAPLFVLGLGALVLRIRQPMTAFIVALLVLLPIPALLTIEPEHGLRLAAEFALIPVIVAAGLLLIWQGVRFVPAWGMIGVVAVLLIAGSWHTVTLYTDYWQHPERAPLAKVHGYELPFDEWFFRTDRRDFAAWIDRQRTPLLIPLAEIERETTRAWLAHSYPAVQVVDDLQSLPPGTQFVLPYALEQDDLMRETRNYVLLQDGLITILPPITPETHTMLLDGIDQEFPIPREGRLPLLGYTKLLSPDITLAFEPTQQADNTLIAAFDDELMVVNWQGPDTLAQTPQNILYTLNWQSTRRIGNEYASFLQLQTQDYQRIAGTDVRMLRWLYPTTLWQTGQTVPVTYTLTLPERPAPGAYRLMVGAYAMFQPPLPAQGILHSDLPDAAMLSWVKVPHLSQPMPPPQAIAINAQINDRLTLTHAHLEPQADNQAMLHLYWQSDAQRPPIDATIFVHVLDADNVIVAQNDSRPQNGQYPTFIWDAGERIETTHLLNIDLATASELRLNAGMYVFQAGGATQRLPATQNNERLPDDVIPLGTVADLYEAPPPAGQTDYAEE